MCGLTLTAKTPDRESVWRNPKPAGAEHLRPYLISFETETEDMVTVILCLLLLLEGQELRVGFVREFRKQQQQKVQEQRRREGK